MQLALFPDCDATLRLPKGRLGTDAKPAVFPGAQSSNCQFHLSLNDVNVDTWDIYASGHARLTVEDSQIDELIAGDHAALTVRNSNLYADWLAVSGDASMTVESGIVGALRLARQRADLATSQVRVSGSGRATFTGVRFDCGIVAADNGYVAIDHSVAAPQYARHSGSAVIRMNGE
jgi:hypothetical protein